MNSQCPRYNQSVVPQGWAAWLLDTFIFPVHNQSGSHCWISLTSLLFYRIRWADKRNDKRWPMFEFLTNSQMNSDACMNIGRSEPFAKCCYHALRKRFSIFLVRRHIFRRFTISIFLDLKAAFDLVDSPVLYRFLSLKSMSETFISVIQSLHATQSKLSSCIRCSFTRIHPGKWCSSGLLPFIFTLQLCFENGHGDGPILMLG